MLDSAVPKSKKDQFRMLTRRDLFSAATALTANALLSDVALAQAPTSQAAAPSSVSADPMAYVHPEFRTALEAMTKLAGSFPPMNSTTLPKMRQMMNSFGRPVLPSPPVTERTIPGPSGAPPVRVFVVGNSSGGSKPAVLHMHGGGYVLGSAAGSRRDIQDLAAALDCVAVSVEYRLAPETPFPGSLEDNYAALRWISTNAKELGIDVKRIAIKGESAGGGHAAALAIAARDRGEFPICLQVLIYPMLDDRTGSSRPMPPFLGRFIWTAEQNRFGWQSLLGVPPGSPEVPPNSVPARVSNLIGIAPAFIGVGSIDLFAPEDVDYAQRLIAAGVSVELNVVPGGFHGFDGIAAKASLSRQFEHTWQEALRRAFTQS
jgi:acetyl esterase/lipase